MTVALPPDGDPVAHHVAGSGGLQFSVVARTVDGEDLAGSIPAGTRSVSVFLVNHRAPNEVNPDLAYAFQAAIEVASDPPLVPRPDLRGVRAADWEIVEGGCRRVRTVWVATAEVEKATAADAARDRGSAGTVECGVTTTRWRGAAIPAVSRIVRGSSPGTSCPPPGRVRQRGPH
jgi:hypothetical protein